jgi:hypothetical protein
MHLILLGFSRHKLAGIYAKKSCPKDNSLHKCGIRSNLSLTGCSQAEPVSVSFDGAKLIAE